MSGSYVENKRRRSRRLCEVCVFVMSAAKRAIFLSMGMIKLRSVMRLTLLVGSFFSLKYLDLISVRQIAGV